MPWRTLARLLESSEGGLPAAYARHLLTVTSTPAERASAEELSAKAQLDTLGGDARGEL